MPFPALFLFISIFSLQYLVLRPADCPACALVTFCSCAASEAEFKEQLGVWDYARVDDYLAVCLLQSRLQHIYHGHRQPYARVDFIPPSGTLDFTVRNLFALKSHPHPMIEKLVSIFTHIYKRHYFQSHFPISESTTYTLKTTFDAFLLLSILALLPLISAHV
jgi:hypothetical protein